VALSALLALQQATAALLIAKGAEAGAANAQHCAATAAATEAAADASVESIAAGVATVGGGVSGRYANDGDFEQQDQEQQQQQQQHRQLSRGEASSATAAAAALSQSTTSGGAPPLYAAVFTALSVAGLLLAALLQWVCASSLFDGQVKTKGFVTAAALVQASAVGFVLALLAHATLGKGRRDHV
jgi:hypothetical protein